MSSKDRSGREARPKLAIVLVTRDSDVEQIDLATFARDRENHIMRTDLDHLPETQQQELQRAVAILREEFHKAIATATQPWKKNGKILKIILFGSYARDDWVDEPENGYQSDFDLLIVVSHPDLTDIANYWYVADDRILHDEAIGRQVNVIVHSLDEVNQALTRGEYFWVDIARDGIALYDLPGSALATPQPLTPADAYEMAAQYFDQKVKDIDVWIETANAQMSRDNDPVRYRRHAAFNLHQAVETAYACFLLVRTLYFPRSHNIKFLRSLSEDQEQRLIAAWPRESRQDRRRFELLKRAYVEARYSDQYEMTGADLSWLAAGVGRLRDAVEGIGRERILELRSAAGLQ